MRTLLKTLRRANDVDDRLAFLHSHCPQSALECRHHLSRIGDFLAVAVGNFDGLLVIRDAIQEGVRLVLVLGREALAIESHGRPAHRLPTLVVEQRVGDAYPSWNG